ncbi:hypothetical protein EJ04DRAFT_336027 [Polyplosphaeria fusca]|uniref:Uncharacterized protein n=1 Tax=Polyplosphaeria fusca TaxID=682080 RepID=A0A9P4QVV4_9PLEO|nr:hypothetical protein EJ04DRAFT_336027 [Polyplosphaeria fusca]
MITNTISDGFQTRQEFHFSTIRENWQLQPNASVFPDSKYLKLPTIISTALILKLVELSESTKYKRHLGHQLLETSHILRREKSSTHVLDELDVQNAINDSRRMNLVLGAYARRRSSSKSSSSAVSGSSSGTPTPPPTSTNALVNWKTPRSAALQAAFALEATSPRRPSVGETSVGSHTRRLSQPSAKIRTKRKQSPSILETGDVRRTNRVCMARDSEPTEKWTRSDCAPRNEEIGAIRCQQPRENMTIETHSTLEPSARTMQIASPDPMLPETSTKLPSVTSLLRYVDARKACPDQ